jgi:hypothetical protein
MMPTRATYAEGAAQNDLPLTCATVKQANAYCAWLGGALPTASQWLVAARGDRVHRYAWGDETPTCDHHPRARTNGESGPLCCGEACPEGEPYRLGTHPANAGAHGTADILITEAELIGREERTIFSACAGNAGACAIRSIAPGAIDGFVAIPDDPHPESYEGPVPTYAFRCAWTEVSK